MPEHSTPVTEAAPSRVSPQRHCGLPLPASFFAPSVLQSEADGAERLGGGAGVLPPAAAFASRVEDPRLPSTQLFSLGQRAEFNTVTVGLKP
jgi:hypothetical protein